MHWKPSFAALCPLVAARYAWYIKDLGWGNLRHMANAAFLALIGAKDAAGGERERLVCWAHGQVQYALGEAGARASPCLAAGGPTRAGAPRCTRHCRAAAGAGRRVGWGAVSGPVPQAPMLVSCVPASHSSPHGPLTVLICAPTPRPLVCGGLRQQPAAAAAPPRRVLPQRARGEGLRGCGCTQHPRPRGSPEPPCAHARMEPRAPLPCQPRWPRQRCHANAPAPPPIQAPPLPPNTNPHTHAYTPPCLHPPDVRLHLVHQARPQPSHRHGRARGRPRPVRPVPRRPH